MDFLIDETYFLSIHRLTPQEQKAADKTCRNLRRNPKNPGMQLEKVDESRDPNFWAARVNNDLRLIVHKAPGRLMLCYVGHHDDAYAWAKRHFVEQHPITGAARFVETPTRIEAVASKHPTGVQPPVKPRLFTNVRDKKTPSASVDPTLLRMLLVDRARSARLITYGGVAEAFGDRWSQGYGSSLVRALNILAVENKKAGEPLLMCLVVSKAKGLPGPGYYEAIGHGNADADTQRKLFMVEVERCRQYRWK